MCNEMTRINATIHEVNTEESFPLGGWSIISGSGGSIPRVSAGSPSVVRFTHSI